MSLSSEQWAFLKDVAALILWADARGYAITGGELQRTIEQQNIYVKSGASRTMNSMHLKKLAIDLAVFRDGVLLEGREAIAPLGKFWESLNTKNRWGGSWRGLVESGKSKFVDTPHFERYIP
jgi:peptidoglycan L-alanyl-D-glutamate endopeptidase CwlK